MGSYDRWVGDIEDYTDEEVVDYSFGEVARQRIVRMRQAWGWCKVRRETAAMLPGESAVAAVLAGDGKKRGKLRILAEELYVIVTVPEDGEATPLLGQWRVEDVEFEGLAEDLAGLCALFQKEAEQELVRAATMTKAIPRYNRLVRKSYFPQARWDHLTRQGFNKVMYRLDKELDIWIEAAASLRTR